MRKDKATSLADHRGTELDASTLFTLKYKGDENGMTRALLQILHSGGIDLLWYLAKKLKISLPEKCLNVITQKKLEHSNPDVGFPVCDGQIVVNPIQLLIESKVKRGCTDMVQLKKYMAVIDDFRDKSIDSMLLYITPDYSRPKELKDLDEYVVWISWSDMMNILGTYPQKTPQLSDMLIGLQGLWNEITGTPYSIPHDKLVAVLAGCTGYPRAVQRGIYNCQPGRTFRNAPYFAFYADRQIAGIFRVVKGPFKNESQYPDLPMEDDFYSLEAIDDIITVPIQNDCYDQRGNLIPLTMGMPRYVDIDTLKKAKTISELKKLNNLK